LSENVLREFGKVGEWLSGQGFAAPGAIDNYLVDAASFSWIAVLLLVVWLAPNTQQIMDRYEPAMNLPKHPGHSPWLTSWLSWTPSIGTAVVICAMGLVAIARLSTRSVFLYFQF
jgi:alginate O-acetyltransferase complex protein AlgI